MEYVYTQDDIDSLDSNYCEKTGLTPDQIIIDENDSEMYEGSYGTIFIADGKLYENHCSHCSCYGCEGQWDPEETTVAALSMRTHFHGVNMNTVLMLVVLAGYTGP